MVLLCQSYVAVAGIHDGINLREGLEQGLLPESLARSSARL